MRRLTNLLTNPRRRIRSDERGFTLIELLVVLVIISMLLAIAVPSYLGFKKRAEKHASNSNVRSSIPSTEAYYSDHETYAGMDLAALQAIDQGISSALVVTVTGGGTGYTLSFTQGGCTATGSGPGGTITNTCP